jgi:hypothetical protein
MHENGSTAINSLKVPICQDHLRNSQVLMDDCHRRNVAIATREKRRTTNAVSRKISKHVVLSQPLMHKYPKCDTHAQVSHLGYLYVRDWYETTSHKREHGGLRAARSIRGLP